MAKLKTNEKSEPATSAEKVNRLMKEYTSKIRSLIREVRAFRDKIDVMVQSRIEEPRDTTPPTHAQAQGFWNQRAGALQNLDQQLCTPIVKVVPPAVKLGQHVSQMINHGQLEDLEKIELSLRLAELESAISVAQDMRHQMPQYHLLWG